MNHLKFMQTDGVPFTNDVAAEFEKSYKIFNAYGDLAGDKTIISGCVENGDQVSPGFVYVNKELFFFEGGYKTEKVALQETVIEKVFENQTSKGLIYIRSITFSNAIDNVWLWSDFERIKPLRELQQEVAELRSEMDVANKKLAIFTKGGVAFAWMKPADQIPEGYAEIIDVRGRTLVGWNPDDPDFDTIWKTGGSKKSKITVQNLPSFEINYKDIYYSEAWGTVQLPGNGYGSHSSDDGNKGYEMNRKAQFTGENADFDTMDPHRIVMFIEWVG